MGDVSKSCKVPLAVYILVKLTVEADNSLALAFYIQERREWD